MNELYREKTQNSLLGHWLKWEILTSREFLQTKSCTRYQLLFCKKDALQNTDFPRLKCQLKRKKNWHSMFVKI